jgi:hypothetical protein
MLLNYLWFALFISSLPSRSNNLLELHVFVYVQVRHCTKLIKLQQWQHHWSMSDMVWVGGSMQYGVTCTEVVSNLTKSSTVQHLVQLACHCTQWLCLHSDIIQHNHPRPLRPSPTKSNNRFIMHFQQDFLTPNKTFASTGCQKSARMNIGMWYISLTKQSSLKIDFLFWLLSV